MAFVRHGCCVMRWGLSMSAFKKSNRVFLSVLSAGAALLAYVSIASAACGAAEGSAVGPSINAAGANARQVAAQKVFSSLNGVPDSLDYSEPACLYLDDGTNNVRCTVTASFCTTPAVYQPEVPVYEPPVPVYQPLRPVYKPRPVFSPRPVAPQSRGSYCSNFSTQVTASSLKRAQRSVIKAMNKALYNSCGASLNDPRVSGGSPACYYLDDGTNAAHCQITVTFCR